MYYQKRKPPLQIGEEKEMHREIQIKAQNDGKCILEVEIRVELVLGPVDVISNMNRSQMMIKTSAGNCGPNDPQEHPDQYEKMKMIVKVPK